MKIWVPPHLQCINLLEFDSIGSRIGPGSGRDLLFQHSSDSPLLHAPISLRRQHLQEPAISFLLLTRPRL